MERELCPFGETLRRGSGRTDTESTEAVEDGVAVVGCEGTPRAAMFALACVTRASFVRGLECWDVCAPTFCGALHRLSVDVVIGSGILPIDLGSIPVGGRGKRVGVGVISSYPILTFPIKWGRVSVRDGPLRLAQGERISYPIPTFPI